LGKEEILSERLYVARRAAVAGSSNLWEAKMLHANSTRSTASSPDVARALTKEELEPHIPVPPQLNIALRTQVSMREGSSKRSKAAIPAAAAGELPLATPGVTADAVAAEDAAAARK